VNFSWVEQLSESAGQAKITVIYELLETTENKAIKNGPFFKWVTR